MGKFNFKTSFGDEHSLEFSASEILLNSYLKGSTNGGAGTEKHSKVLGEDLSALLKTLNLSTSGQLEKYLSDASQEELDDFAKLVREHEFVTFRWAETDWSEEK